MTRTENPQTGYVVTLYERPAGSAELSLIGPDGQEFVQQYPWYEVERARRLFQLISAGITATEVKG